MEQMNDKKINRTSLIITIAAIVVIAGLIVYGMKHPAVSDNSQATATDQTESVCYYMNNPAGNGAKGSDIAYFKLTVGSTDTTATGELGTALAEKDAMNGAITGIISPSTDPNSDGYVLDGQYTTNAEGMNNVTEQLVSFDSTKAQIGYGDMVKNADGSYSYKDKTKVTYSLNIPRVDCAQYDSLKMVQAD